MGDRTIVLGDSLASLPWHLRVNLGTEDISVLMHHCQREGLKILERCCEERVTSSAAWKGDTWDVNGRPETVITV